VIAGRLVQAIKEVVRESSGITVRIINQTKLFSQENQQQIRERTGTVYLRLVNRGYHRLGLGWAT
jgi:hypothetical protein